jgi:hypothetical protein
MLLAYIQFFGGIATLLTTPSYGHWFSQLQLTLFHRALYR